MNYLEMSLISSYNEIFLKEQDRPEWAVRRTFDNRQIVPTVPFVGKEYKDNNCKMLVYASAENLTYVYDDVSNNKFPNIFNDEFAINRHRKCFDNSEKLFPNVHLKPMTNGCLLLVIAYIYNKITQDSLYANITPKEFYEMISFGNFGKFSIASKSKNIDYANKKEYLKYSLEYIKKDLEILKPDYLIIPKSIYKTMKYELAPILGNIKVISISQINSTTINCHISKKYPKKNIKDLPNFLRNWYEFSKPNDGLQLSGKCKDNYRSVFCFVDTIIDNVIK